MKAQIDILNHKVEELTIRFENLIGKRISINKRAELIDREIEQLRREIEPLRKQVDKINHALMQEC